MDKTCSKLPPRPSCALAHCRTGATTTQGSSSLTLSQKNAVEKLTRQTYVIGIYRWLIEVAFLFAAFTEFPEHKWSVGLAVLAFGAAISAVIHVQQAIHTIANMMMDQGERKTRHAILLAGELAGKNVGEIDERYFWGEVDRRVESETHRSDEPETKPTGSWKGLLLATASLLSQLAASLFGIGLVAALTA